MKHLKFILLIFVSVSVTSLFAQKEITDTIHLKYIEKMSPKLDYVIFQNKTYSILVRKIAIINTSKGNDKLSNAFIEVLEKSEHNIYAFIMKEHPELEMNLLLYSSFKIEEKKCMLFNRKSKKYETDIYSKDHHDTGTSGVLYLAKDVELFYIPAIIY